MLKNYTQSFIDPLDFYSLAVVSATLAFEAKQHGQQLHSKAC